MFQCHTPFKWLYKQNLVLEKDVSRWIKYKYNKLNEKFILCQVGACLQVGSCYEGWIPHFLVGYENYKLGLVYESWISLIELDRRIEINISWS
jgi:hypothetical protein